MKFWKQSAQKKITHTFNLHLIANYVQGQQQRQKANLKKS